MKMQCNLSHIAQVGRTPLVLVGAFSISRQWEISLVPLTALFLQLHLGGVHAQGGHDGAQLLGGDAAVPVLVEHQEHLLELRHLLLGQLLVSHAHIHHYTEADNYY